MKLPWRFTMSGMQVAAVACNSWKFPIAWAFSQFLRASVEYTKFTLAMHSIVYKALIIMHTGIPDM